MAENKMRGIVGYIYVMTSARPSSKSARRAFFLSWREIRGFMLSEMNSYYLKERWAFSTAASADAFTLLASRSEGKAQTTHNGQLDG